MKIPLVRAEGKVFASGHTLTPELMIHHPQLLRASKTETTREVEEYFRMGDCLYLFAGHACPAFGHIVFAFEATIADDVLGGATPFDSGGLHARKIHATGADDPLSYFNRFRVQLAVWRERFEAYLATHFGSARDYVLGSRAHTDDETCRLLDERNERRAWTWEVQLQVDIELLNGLKLLCVSAEVSESLRRELRRLDDTQADPWYRLMDSPRFRVAPSGASAPMVCAMAEEEILSWL